MSQTKSPRLAPGQEVNRETAQVDSLAPRRPRQGDAANRIVPVLRLPAAGALGGVEKRRSRAAAAAAGSEVAMNMRTAQLRYDAQEAEPQLDDARVVWLHDLLSMLCDELADSIQRTSDLRERINDITDEINEATR
jgi:hypothetical protein